MTGTNGAVERHEPRFQATITWDDGAKLYATFIDGSERDVTGIAHALMALGAEVLADHTAAGGTQPNEDPTGGLDHAATIDIARSGGELHLYDNGGSIFVLHHGGGDEVIERAAALNLISTGITELLRRDSS